MTQKFEHLCLGHATIGAYSCFKEATHALDSEGDGYCADHARFLEENVDKPICTKCAVFKEALEGQALSAEGKVYKLVSGNPNCTRCHGTGIDPFLVRKERVEDEDVLRDTE